MLNLLIALISDTYEIVIAAERKNSNFESAQLIFSIEQNLPEFIKNKFNFENSFIIYSKCIKDEEEDSDQINRMRARVEQIRND